MSTPTRAVWYCAECKQDVVQVSRAQCERCGKFTYYRRRGATPDAETDELMDIFVQDNKRNAAAPTVAVPPATASDAAPKRRK